MPTERERLLRCLRCGHKWVSRLRRPKTCPFELCKSSYWDLARRTKMNIGGQKWHQLYCASELCKPNLMEGNKP
jgi:hypothetical protein